MEPKLYLFGQVLNALVQREGIPWDREKLINEAWNLSELAYRKIEPTAINVEWENEHE